jgi:hypothetical protein
MALLTEYPISTVHALARAAQANRTFDIISFSGAVAAGAVHAVEAGFSGKQPKALKNYQKALMNSVKKAQSRGQGQKADADTLLQGFGGLAKTEKKRGRD